MGNAKARTWPEVAVAGAPVSDIKIVYKLGELEGDADKDVREMMMQDIVVRRSRMIEAFGLPSGLTLGGNTNHALAETKTKIFQEMCEERMKEVADAIMRQDLITMNIISKNGIITQALATPRAGHQSGLADVMEYLCRRYIKVSTVSHATIKVFETGVANGAFRMLRRDALVAQTLMPGAMLPWRLVQDTIAALESLGAEIELCADHPKQHAGTTARLYAHFLRSAYVKHNTVDSDKPMGVCWQHDGDPDRPTERKWAVEFNVFTNMLNPNVFWVRDPPETDWGHIDYVSVKE